MTSVRTLTNDEIDEINDALEDSMKYYKDLLDVSQDSDPEAAKMKIEYAHTRIRIIESIKKEIETVM